MSQARATVAELAEWARRCAVCGWLLSDAAAHVEATYEDHSGEAEPARAWRDRQGDVWKLGEDGLLWTAETAPFPREHVERKWGPLVAVPEPDVSETPSTG